MTRQEEPNWRDDHAYGAGWNIPSFLQEAIRRKLQEGIRSEDIRIIPHIGHKAQPEIVATPLLASELIRSNANRNHCIYVNIRSDNRFAWLLPLLLNRSSVEVIDKTSAAQSAIEPWRRMYFEYLGTDDEKKELDYLDIHRQVLKVNPKATTEWIEHLGAITAEEMAKRSWNPLFYKHLVPNYQEFECLETHSWLLQVNPNATEEWIERLGFMQIEKGWIQPDHASPVQWLARLLRAMYPQLTDIPDPEIADPYRFHLVDGRFILERSPNLRIKVPDSRTADTKRDNALELSEQIFTQVFWHLASIEMLEGVAYPMDWCEEKENKWQWGLETPSGSHWLTTLDPITPWVTRDKSVDQPGLTFFEENGLLEGISLDEVHITLMAGWISTEGFLGLTRSEWNLFSMVEQGLLLTLLLKQQNLMDYGSLFVQAVQRLIYQYAVVSLDAYQRVDCQLGTPLAQLGLSLVIQGDALLRAPCAVVYLPYEYPVEPEGERIRQKLEALRRLFLPAHLPLHCRWQIDRAVLGETAWLDDGESPLTSLGLPLQSRMASDL